MASSGAPSSALLCVECKQPIAWFNAGTNGPLSGWIHTNLDGGDWSHRAQPPAPPTTPGNPYKHADPGTACLHCAWQGGWLAAVKAHDESGCGLKLSAVFEDWE